MQKFVIKRKPLGLNRFLPVRDLRKLVWTTLGVSDKSVISIAHFCTPPNVAKNAAYYLKILRQTNNAFTEQCAANGYLSLLQWVCANGCYYVHDVCYGAARSGHLHVLQWARARGFNWDDRTTDYAAKNGHLEVLQWAIENGCQVDLTWLSRYAASSGNLEMVKWLHVVHGFQFDLQAVAFSGSVQVLEWLRSIGCPWDELTCTIAARSGNLEVLQWARDLTAQKGNVCPWDEGVCEAAAMNGHLDILKWLRAQSPPAPWNSWTCAQATCNSKYEVLDWIHRHGCPCDCAFRENLTFAKKLNIKK